MIGNQRSALYLPPLSFNLYPSYHCEGSIRSKLMGALPLYALVHYQRCYIPRRRAHLTFIDKSEKSKPAQQSFSVKEGRQVSGLQAGGRQISH